MLSRLPLLGSTFSKRRLRFAWPFLACLCSLAGSPGLAQDDQGEREVDPLVLEQAWLIAKSRFYDRGLHGADWDSALERYLPRAKAALSQRELHDVVLEMLGELKASHTTLLEGAYLERFIARGPKRVGVPQFGMTITRLPQGYFVSRILPGSSSHAAGVRRGDRLLSIDGRPPHPRRLLLTFYEPGLEGPRSYRVPCGVATEVQLEFERTPTPMGRYRVRVRAHPWNETAASLYSRRVITRGGLRFGYVRIYHLLGYDAPSLTGDMIRRHPDLDGMIVDLRGRGGLPEAALELVSLFDRSRVAGSLGPASSSKPCFSKPCVALIDHETRSAKELVALEWRRRKIGALVGQRTRGAFLGVGERSLEVLSDGSILVVPTTDMRSILGGVEIEGVGIAPDVEVEDALPYANGRDRILERGLDTIRGAVLASRRRQGGWH